MNNIFLYPSFYAHIINGLLLLYAIIFLYKYNKELKNSRSYEILIIILLFSISVGIHGLSHLGLENSYNFNPLINK